MDIWGLMDLVIYTCVFSPLYLPFPDFFPLPLRQSPLFNQTALRLHFIVCFFLPNLKVRCHSFFLSTHCSFPLQPFPSLLTVPDTPRQSCFLSFIFPGLYSCYVYIPYFIGYNLRKCQCNSLKSLLIRK